MIHEPHTHKMHCDYTAKCKRDQSLPLGDTNPSYMITQSPPCSLSIWSTSPPASRELPRLSLPSRSTINTPVLCGSMCAEIWYLQ